MRQFNWRICLILGFVHGMLLWTGSASEARAAGRTAMDRWEVSGFNAVALHMKGDLDVRFAERERLQVEAEIGALAYIEAVVVDSVLVIRKREGINVEPSGPVHFRLAVRELDRVVLAGSGRIYIPRITGDRLYVQHRGSGRIDIPALEVGALSVHVSGSGDVELGHTRALRCRSIVSGSGNVSARRLVGLSNEARLTGSGDVSVSEGSVVQQSVFLSGSGKFVGAGLQTSETEVMVSGGGSASVCAEDQLDATITGRGDIRYRGSPHIMRSISGAGKLKKIR